MERRLSLAAVVLAAGAGTRFATQPGAKLLAAVDGQPMLARVLEEVRAYGPATTVVVLGHAADPIEQTLAWVDEIRVRNHAPELGLASSLQVGIDALRALPDAFDGAFIVLGDQPRIRARTMHALEAAAAASRPADRPALEAAAAASRPAARPALEAAAAASRPADRPAIVPRYDTPGPRNPVLLLRPAWSWVDELEGDHGLGHLIAARPDAVLEVRVAGEMPDVDTPDDLADLTSA